MADEGFGPWPLSARPAAFYARPQGAVDPSDQHWWCRECGAFDGPHGDGDQCDVCADVGHGSTVERLVPSTNPGAVDPDNARPVMTAERESVLYVNDSPKRRTLGGVNGGYVYDADKQHVVAVTYVTPERACVRVSFDPRTGEPSIQRYRENG